MKHGGLLNNVIVTSLALGFEREKKPQGYQYVISIIYFISHFKRVADKCKHNLMDNPLGTGHSPATQISCCTVNKTGHLFLFSNFIFYNDELDRDTCKHKINY